MSIKVISFNIRCVDDPNNHSIPERAPCLATVMASYDADIIGFQEYSAFWEEDIEKYFCDKYEFFNKYRTDGDGLEGTPILWKKDKFECLQRGYFWLSDTPEVMSGGWDDYGCNRICLYVILKNKEDGKTFFYLNTHFGFGEENQVKSVRLIQDYVQKLSSYPSFITGDFNLFPNSRPYNEMVKKYADANELTIKDRRATYHGYDPIKNTIEHIDYCFINKQVRPITFKIIDETVDGKFPSDHFGIFIDLEII